MLLRPQPVVLLGARPLVHGAAPPWVHISSLLSSQRCVALLHDAARLPLPGLGTRPGRTGCCSRTLVVSCLPSKAPRRRRFPVALSAPTAAAGARPGYDHAHAWGVHGGACTSRVQCTNGCTRKRGCNTSLRLQTWVQTHEWVRARVGAGMVQARSGACMLQPGSSPCLCTSMCVVQARTVSV